MQNYNSNSKSKSKVAQSCPTVCDPMTVAYQAPLSMGFSRQEYWCQGLLQIQNYNSNKIYLCFLHDLHFYCTFQLATFPTSYLISFILGPVIQGTHFLYKKKSNRLLDLEMFLFNLLNTLLLKVRKDILTCYLNHSTSLRCFIADSQTEHLLF